jgi:hypothetical protein
VKQIVGFIVIGMLVIRIAMADSITLPNGATYEGDVTGGQPNGKGTMILRNGQRYDGDWVNGHQTGKGVYTWPNKIDEGSTVNFYAFCVAYGIANAKGYSGWSMTMKPPEGPAPTERLLTIILGNKKQDVMDVPVPADWTGYVDNKEIFEKTCKHFVNAKYVKSSGASEASAVNTVNPKFLLSTVEPEARKAETKIQEGKTFRDCPKCPEMVVIPSGSFQMGSPKTEIGRVREDESPVHEVSRVEFSVGWIGSEYVMSIQDDGVGMKAAENRDTQYAGLGMVTMRERSQACGGRIEVQSVPGSGTQLTVRVPV